MLKAISRYGARVLPNTQQLIRKSRERGELVQGPAVEEFEFRFARLHDHRPAIATSFGRMAFYYILKALHLPAGSEIVFPALTFWVIPEIARVLGLKPVFVDVDPATYNMDPQSLAQSITPQTRAVVPTHLYGLPCDMGPILEIAGRHNLRVIEDCAHALCALYQGRPVGTFGDAAFFSFQTLKPLNTYGGGMAVVGDSRLAAEVRRLVEAEPWPTEAEVEKRLLVGRVQRIFIRPAVFRWTLFPVLWLASYLGARPDVYLWEKIRPLDPLPEHYRRRYSNVQAILGLEGLSYLVHWTAETRRNAQILSRRLAELRGWQLPYCPPDRTHVFYQYCVRTPNREWLVRQCIRRGLDLETLHVDLCTKLPLFQEFWREARGAEAGAQAIQVPVYSSLSEEEMEWICCTIKEVAGHGEVAGRAMARSIQH